MEKEEFLKIIERITDGSATDHDIELYLKWYGFFEVDHEMWDKLNVEPSVFKQELFSHIQKAISEDKQPVPNRRPVKLWARLTIAASLIFCIGLAVLYYVKTRESAIAHTTLYTHKQHIVPGSNQAVLTLADGRRIILDGQTHGEVAEQDGVSINKTATGQLIYRSADDEQAGIQDKPIFNTISIPRGGQYQLILPDGSKVFLNAASSLRYPARFSKSDRRVELQGEAYFEIAKNPNKPFIVEVEPKQEIEVLGTHFNVTAYPDESVVKTTLFEGSVKLSSAKKELVLKPGEMGVSNGNGEILLKKADLEAEAAWKDGLFVFNDRNLEEVMLTVARWYDIEVVYSGNIGNKKLWGTVSRYKTIKELLDKIAFTSGLHYKIEGKRVTLTE